jgi:hypothetical protein
MEGQMQAFFEKTPLMPFARRASAPPGVVEPIGLKSGSFAAKEPLAARGGKPRPTTRIRSF